MSNTTTSSRKYHSTNFGDEFADTERQPKARSRKLKVWRPISDDYRLNSKYFGRNNGKRIGDVSAAQLDLWADAQWVHDLFPEVIDYIERNRSAIDQDLKRDTDTFDW
jgi:hypothetical protein